MIQTFTKSSEPNGWMGNMCGFYNKESLSITLNGKKWNTSENIFQAMRFPKDSPIREQIRKVNGFKGKQIAKANKHLMIVEEQSIEDVSNMVFCVIVKLKQHTKLYKELKSLEGIIIEDVSNRLGGSSLFWGAAKVGKRWIGYNVLGLIFTILKHLDELPYPTVENCRKIAEEILLVLDKNNLNK